MYAFHIKRKQWFHTSMKNSFIVYCQLCQTNYIAVQTPVIKVATINEITDDSHFACHHVLLPNQHFLLSAKINGGHW